MLTIPVYLRGSSYYLHTRIFGRQIKRSLHTADKQTAIIKASKILEGLRMAIDLSKIQKFEIDLSRGVLRADGADDHQRMMEALALLKETKATNAPPAPTGEPFKNIPAGPATQSKATSGLKLNEITDKFFQLKRQLKPATVVSYKNVMKELASFLGNPFIVDIGISDITRYQEHLIDFNSPRTIDNKMATVRIMFNFALKQGYYFGKNPGMDRTILRKSDKEKAGYGVFTEEQIELIFKSDFMATAKEKDPDYYWTLMFGLFTAARISEITSLTSDQFQTVNDVNFIGIKDSKTKAGIREIPFPSRFLTSGFSEFAKGKNQIFKYKLRLGKGSGNAVGKKFKRHLEELNINGNKLVFHSLRKFTNDFMMKNEIQLEPRCQMLGHEVDSINVGSYSTYYQPDKLQKIIAPVIFKIEVLSGLVKTKF